MPCGCNISPTRQRYRSWTTGWSSALKKYHVSKQRAHIYRFSDSENNIGIIGIHGVGSLKMFAEYWIYNHFCSIEIEVIKISILYFNFQSQIVEKNSMKLQLDDFKLANADLVDQLEKSQKNVSKLKLKVFNYNFTF